MLRNFATRFAIGFLLSAVVVMGSATALAGTRNCKPAWKCQPGPTATVRPTVTLRPTVIPTAAPGIPPIPAGYGTKFRKDFGDGQLAPFTVLTYPNDHPESIEHQYCDFVTDGHISVHDGYLDLRATRTSGGRWACSLVGTWTVGGLPQPIFKWQYGTSRVMARTNSGKGVWNGVWHWAADCWCSEEIDWTEVIAGRFTANLHGSGSDGQKLSMAPVMGWHEYGVVRTPTYIALLLDGVEMTRVNVAMSANLTLNADAKIGLEAPDSTTPDPFMQVAWWVVD